MTTAVNASSSNNTSDEFACKSSFYKTDCLSRTHQTSLCWATITDSITTWV